MRRSIHALRSQSRLGRVSVVNGQRSPFEDKDNPNDSAQQLSSTATVRAPLGRVWETIADADTFVAKLVKLFGLMDTIRMKHLFVDGDRACCVYGLVTATPVGDSPAAEYITAS